MKKLLLPVILITLRNEGVKMKRDLNSIHRISTLQDASRFHDIGVGKTSTRFSKIGDLHTFHKGYSASLYKRGKAPMNIDAVNSPYNEGSTGHLKDF